MTRVDLSRMFPQRKGEDDRAWTGRVLSHAQEHGTNRQCSIGWHEECSDPRGESCQCLCHDPATKSYTVEGYPENGVQSVTRVVDGEVRMPPQPGEPDGMWAEWILARSPEDAAVRAIQLQEAKRDA